MPSNEQNIARVRAFFAQWGRGYDELHASYGQFFSADCVWENSGFPATHGPEEAVAVMLEPARESMALDTIKVDIEHIACEHDVVFTERVDHLVRTDGSVIVSVPLVGVMEIADDGRVRRWREYFDPKPMFETVEQLAADSAGNA